MTTKARLCLTIGFIALLTILQGTALAQSDTSNPGGRWYLNAQSTRMIFKFEKQNEVWRGVSLDEQGKVLERLEYVTWNNKTRVIEFCRIGSGFWQWYRGKIVEGVLVARFTHSGKTDAKPADPLAFKWKATGWNYEYLTTSLTPQVYEIAVVETGFRARLRIDKANPPAAGFQGRLKFYAWNNLCAEGLENDVTIDQWDGINLRFRASNINLYPNLNMSFTGKVNGRNFDGTLVQTEPGKTYYHNFKGTRSEVLSYGLAEKTAISRADWQRRARRQLEHLMMAGYPTPVKSEVKIIRESLSPLLGVPLATRDDSPNSFPQNYRLSEFTIRHTLENPFGGLPLARESHGYIAKPTFMPSGATRSMGRFPLVIAVNGHGGSAWQTFDPSSMFWYGDAFARQGYMVMSIDISHRPTSDLITSGGPSNNDMLGYFNDAYARGDDAARGNRARTSIKPLVATDIPNPELFTDWEEDGERVWDVRRAIDYAVTRADVDPTRIIVVGLSMGGEVASYVGALDPRISVTITAGFSPDLNTLKYQGSHGCWNWHYADIRDYIDSSELFALVAPRPLIIETGKQDFLYHCNPDHFAGDKQIARRVRAAFNDAPDNFIHYLHSDFHVFRAGGPNNRLPDRYVQVPTVIAPRLAGDQRWQTDSNTWAPKQWTVFQYVANWMSLRTVASK